MRAKLVAFVTLFALAACGDDPAREIDAVRASAIEIARVARTLHPASDAAALDALPPLRARLAETRPERVARHPSVAEAADAFDARLRALVDARASWLGSSTSLATADRGIAEVVDALDAVDRLQTTPDSAPRRHDIRDTRRLAVAYKHRIAAVAKGFDGLSGALYNLDAAKEELGLQLAALRDGNSALGIESEREPAARTQLDAAVAAFARVADAADVLIREGPALEALARPLRDLAAADRIMDDATFADAVRRATARLE